SMYHRRLIAVALLVAFAAAGCDEMKKRRDAAFGQKDPDPVPDVPPLSDSKSVQDTVQSVASLDGMRKLIVRGYGLVIGLLGTGGTDCPEDVRKYLPHPILHH